MNQPSIPPALEVRDLTKSFDRQLVRGGYTTFKTQLVQWLRPRLHREQVERQKLNVLRGLNFRVSPGETVGIIGQNGAGKSTLLKLLTGVYKPSSGSVRRHGRVSALLELGAGFHPEFSGRENIYMNGMILGLSRKQLKEREQKIIDFAEMEDFIDAPVRTYSSGMYVRLAFAVAVNVEPDILIIDEVLAVGDAHFAHKSKAKLDEFKTKNRAIILVTHDLGAIEKWCTRAIWLHQGKIAADGNPRFIVQQYLTEVARAEAETPSVAEASKDENRWGREPSHLGEITTTTTDGTPRIQFQSGDDVRVNIAIRGTDALPPQTTLSLIFRSPDGQRLVVASRRLSEISHAGGYEHRSVACVLRDVRLNARYVDIDVALTDHKGSDIDYRRQAARVDVLGREDEGIVCVSAEWNEQDTHAASESREQAS